MKFRAKIAILMISIFITLIGFDLMIPSSVIDMLKIGKKIGYRITANVLTEETRIDVLASFFVPSSIDIPGN